MRSLLQQAVFKRDESEVERITGEFRKNPTWSFAGVIDELLTFSLLQSNLRYGSFHESKMQLFLRRLAREGYFSPETEAALARLAALETARSRWIDLQAGLPARSDPEAEIPLRKMVEELADHNVHNAYYYASVLLREDPERLIQTLLVMGAEHIAQTLGHSLSCFFPIMEEIVAPAHRLAAPALFSYLLYLSRFRVDPEAVLGSKAVETDRVLSPELLRRCASGDGIVNLHHMITFFIFTEWKNAVFNRKQEAPFARLADWIGDKGPDRETEKRMAELRAPSALPGDFSDFSRRFSFQDLEGSAGMLFGLLETNPRPAVDWLFRLYASYHGEVAWDPHYVTGLYAALRLHLGRPEDDPVAGRMALFQALRYFAGNLNRTAGNS